MFQHDAPLLRWRLGASTMLGGFIFMAVSYGGGSVLLRKWGSSTASLRGRGAVAIETDRGYTV